MSRQKSETRINISNSKSLCYDILTYVPLGPTLPFIESLFEPVGLYPKMPQKAAGILADPPESDPTPNALALVDTRIASPPDEPPLMKFEL